MYRIAKLGSDIPVASRHNNIECATVQKGCRGAEIPRQQWIRARRDGSNHKIWKGATNTSHGVPVAVFIF